MRPLGFSEIFLAAAIPLGAAQVRTGGASVETPVSKMD